MALIGLVALGLTGCGPKQATLTVEMKDFAYVPNQWSVPAGAQVTLNVKNSGTQIHEWVIMKKGDKAVSPWDSHPENENNIFWELDDVEAGNAKTATFTAPTEPGDYQIVCGTPAHIEQGMVGTLTVTP
jgi:uncharacterized cupredoxin-like copper-binding protein